jgi:hypothetical protein
LRNLANDKADKLVWKWVPGQATAIDDFGQPNVDTSYALCIYDQYADEIDLVLTVEVPPALHNCNGSERCWKQTNKGFVYTDAWFANNGVKTVSMKKGIDGHAFVMFHGRGPSLGLSSIPPSRSPATNAPLTQQQKVIVQFWNSKGVCWASTFSTPAVRNSSGLFRDRSD